MEDNNRINRRSRPRPYDLRRKVLLKNFLREQMTHISETRIDSTSQSAAGFTEEASVQLDLPELNESLSSTCSENVRSSSSLADDNINNNSDLISVDAVEIASDVHNSAPDAIASDDNHSEFSSMVKFRKSQLKKESKPSKTVFKAKEKRKQLKSPMKTRSSRNGLKKAVYDFIKARNNRSATYGFKPSILFNLIKFLKLYRPAKEADRTKTSSNSQLDAPTNCSTVNQAVQTDDSWAREEIVKVKQSNRRLKEENRLLSESLSYFMSGASMDPHVRQSDTLLQKGADSTIFHDYCLPSPSFSDRWNSKSRVSRSKFVNEQNGRKTLLRSPYPTRSASFNNRRDIPSQSGSIYVPQNDVNCPIVRRKNMFTDSPSSGTRSIQRRASIHGRILAENARWDRGQQESVPCRRSNSMQDSRRRSSLRFHDYEPVDTSFLLDLGI